MNRKPTVKSRELEAGPHAASACRPRSSPLRFRPFVLVNMSMSADGKIATFNRFVSTFSSPCDQAHLLELRATADAVMAGARTVDLNSINLGPGPARYRCQRLKNGLGEYNLRIIASGSGSINPTAEVFRHRFSPIVVLTTALADRNKREQLQTVADAVKICGRTQIDWPATLRWLRAEWNVKRLLCEGGGELNAALFRAGLVDELHLTICPTILGGRLAPTIADGAGMLHLGQATQFQLKSLTRKGAELFAVYGAVPA